MKKLIEELEKEKQKQSERKTFAGYWYAKGLDLALEIVKSHDPWIDVSELPPREVNSREEESYTIDVITKDNFGEIWKAFYSHGRNVWYESYGENILDNTPTHWTYLPEAKP